MGTPVYWIKPCTKIEQTTSAQRIVTRRAEETSCVMLEPDLLRAGPGPVVTCGHTQ
jgi:hypothetical protein